MLCRGWFHQRITSSFFVRMLKVTYNVCTKKLQKCAFVRKSCSKNVGEIDTWGGQTFLIVGQISKLFLISGRTTQNYLFENSNFCKTETNYWSFWDKFCAVFDQICLKIPYVLLYHGNLKGPRAAKISWRAACGPRAALWPCLFYCIKTKFEWVSFSDSKKRKQSFCLLFWLKYFADWWNQ